MEETPVKKSIAITGRGNDLEKQLATEEEMDVTAGKREQAAREAAPL